MTDTKNLKSLKKNCIFMPTAYQKVLHQNAIAQQNATQNTNAQQNVFNHQIAHDQSVPDQTIIPIEDDTTIGMSMKTRAPKSNSFINMIFSQYMMNIILLTVIGIVGGIAITSLSFTLEPIVFPIQRNDSRIEQESSTSVLIPYDVTIGGSLTVTGDTQIDGTTHVTGDFFIGPINVGQTLHAISLNNGTVTLNETAIIEAVTASQLGIDVTQLKADVIELNDDIENTTRRVNATEFRLTEVEGRMTNAETRLNNTEFRLTEVEGRMTNAETRLTNAESATTTLALRVTGTEQRLTTAETRQNLTETAATTLTSRVSAAEALLFFSTLGLTGISTTKTIYAPDLVIGGVSFNQFLAALQNGSNATFSDTNWVVTNTTKLVTVYTAVASDFVSSTTGHTLSTVGAVVDELGTTVDDHTSTLSSHTSTLSSHTSDLASHTSTLSSHTSTLSSHTSTLASHTGALDDLYLRNTNVNTLLNTTNNFCIETNRTNAEEISLLKGRANTLETTVGDHTSTLASHTSTLSSHTSTLSSHTSTLSSHTSTLSSHAGALEDLYLRNTNVNTLLNTTNNFCIETNRTNAEEISLLKGRANALETTVGDHTSTLSSHTSTLSSHTSTLSSHTSTLSSHTSTLSSHTSTLDSHTTSISTLVDTVVTRSGNLTLDSIPKGLGNGTVVASGLKIGTNESLYTTINGPGLTNQTGNTGLSMPVYTQTNQAVPGPEIGITILLDTSLNVTAILIRRTSDLLTQFTIRLWRYDTQVLVGTAILPAGPVGWTKSHPVNFLLQPGMYVIAWTANLYTPELDHADCTMAGGLIQGCNGLLYSATPGNYPSSEFLHTNGLLVGIDLEWTSLVAATLPYTYTEKYPVNPTATHIITKPDTSGTYVTSSTQPTAGVLMASTGNAHAIQATTIDSTKVITSASQIASGMITTSTGTGNAIQSSGRHIDYVPITLWGKCDPLTTPGTVPCTKSSALTVAFFATGRYDFTFPAFSQKPACQATISMVPDAFTYAVYTSAITTTTCRINILRPGAAFYDLEFSISITGV